MTVLTEAKLAERCQGPFWKGPDHVNFDGQEFFFTDPEAACIYLKIPGALDGLPCFLRAIATVGHPAEDFQGALIVLTQWGIWNYESTGYRIVERMNAGAGQPAAFEAAPGHLFRADELTDAVGTLLQPIIFGWDAYYVPSWTGGDDFFLHVSHDGYVVVVARTKAFHAAALKDLGDCGIQAELLDPAQAEGFCRHP